MIISFPVVPHKIELQKITVAVVISWLFQLSGILGIALGYEEWFLSKTPLNLSVQFCLLLWVFPFKNRLYQLSMMAVILLGFSIEAVGTNFGFPFGAYEYGQNLGVKVLGVPILIACNWALLGFLTTSITNYFNQPIWLKSIIGATLMVLLDLAIEIVAPSFDFWSFEQGFAPWNNYLSWFITAFIINLFLHSFKISGNRIFSLNLFLSQFLFFLYFAFTLN